MGKGSAMMRSAAFLGVCAVLVLAGCMVGTESESEDFGSDQAALKSDGCKLVCPKCHPGEPCPLRPCVLECRQAHTQCGDNVCTKGEYCCNESCGICAPEGGFCTQQICQAAGVACGPSTCAEGDVCCNPSCGICTPPGGFCTQQFCF